MEKQVYESLKQSNVQQHALDKLAALPPEVQKQINWPALLAWVASDGPGIVLKLVSLFSGTA